MMYDLIGSPGALGDALSQWIAPSDVLGVVLLLLLLVVQIVAVRLVIRDGDGLGVGAAVNTPHHA